jgi:hypothetical protein
MALPDSYTIKVGAISHYFQAIVNAEAPERFSQKFLENLGFKGTNDRLLIGIMKDLGFIDTDGVPKPKYYELLDRSRWRKVLAQAIREAYADLFAVNKEAHALNLDDAKNKLRTLYAGSKKDSVIANIAKTFRALCEEADFSTEPTEAEARPVEKEEPKIPLTGLTADSTRKPTLDSLQYHINIVLPETRDQAVYDAIFKSLRDHLG